MTDERRLSGTVIDGRYSVGPVLGVGGMSTVYLAHDARLDRDVAVKVISPSLGSDESFIRRFSTEARASARLAHPNIVHVLDRSDEQSLPYIVFEFVPGRTLRQLIRDEAPLPNRAALLLWRQLIEALGHAHEAGIIHRDVKPDNVLVTDRGHAKLTDFGLARAVAEARTTATIMGTARYVAPEVISDAASDSRSDIYSAGILLFELVTGAPPFTGANPINVAYAHVHRDVPPPSSREPRVHAEVDSLVQWCCAREPDERPQTAQDILPEIDHILSILPPDPVQPPRPSRPPFVGAVGASADTDDHATQALALPSSGDQPATRTLASASGQVFADDDGITRALPPEELPTQALGSREHPAHALGGSAQATQALGTVPLPSQSEPTQALGVSATAAPRQAQPPAQRSPLVLEVAEEDEDETSSEALPLTPHPAGEGFPAAVPSGSSSLSRRERRAQNRSARQPLRSVRRSGNSTLTAIIALMMCLAVISLGVTLFLTGMPFPFFP